MIGEVLSASSSDHGHQDLTALFAPSSVAVVGASNDRSKWGGDVAARLLEYASARPVYLVNCGGGLVHGRSAFRSLADVPGQVDMVVIAVPAVSFPAAVDDALACGARAIVALSAGLGELSEEGRSLEEGVVARVRRAGAVLVGPNCAGLADTGTGLNAVGLMDIPPGRVAFVGQSGGIGEEVVIRVAERGHGFSRYVTLGNQADLSVTEVLWSLVGHAGTEVVSVYVESLLGGRELAEAAAACVASGTPVLLLVPGRSPASADAARSHTGAMTTDTGVVDAVCRATGAVRVDTPAELADLALGCLSGRFPRGPRLAIVSDAGGHGAVAADVAVECGLKVPSLSDAVRLRLRELLPRNAGVSNPVDFAMASTDAALHASVAEVLAASGEVDAVLIAGEFGFWGSRFPELEREGRAEIASAEALVGLARASGLPLVVSSVNADTAPAARVLARAGVPVHRDLRSAATVIRRLLDVCAQPSGIPSLPAREAAELTSDTYWTARCALERAGIPVVPGRLVRSREDALAAAREIGYPVVLKAHGLVHKSDSGGVALELSDAGALAGAYDDMTLRLGVAEYSVERMASLCEGVELILGCRQDRRFGPVALVGSGGIHAEVLADLRLALAPLDTRSAVNVIGALKIAPLLAGRRGRPALDLQGAARALVTLSSWAAAHPEVAEVEINPLLVQQDTVLALDARVVLRGDP